MLEVTYSTTRTLLKVATENNKQILVKLYKYLHITYIIGTFSYESKSGTQSKHA